MVSIWRISSWRTFREAIQEVRCAVSRGCPYMGSFFFCRGLGLRRAYLLELLPMNQTIFVFGSNTAGVHGAGAALAAYQKHGARYGIGYGLCGDSFAIPTKDRNIESLDIKDVEDFVKGFLAFARDRSDVCFQVTRIGCGLAGFKDEDIARLFYDAPQNCYFDTAWTNFLREDARFWGTF